MVLQALGLDPFASLAPEVEGARLRLYGTLGNPDFVASVLGVTAPLALVAAMRSRASGGTIAGASSVVQLVALALLRSFATTLSLGVAALVAVAAAPRGRNRRVLAVALVAGVVVSAIRSPAARRSPPSRAAATLASTAAPHVADAPWLGQGPGTVVLRWPAWELERWRARCGTDAACVAAHPESRFAGLQDHVHDDWLERLLEGGALGLLALVGLFLAALVTAVRSASLEGQESPRLSPRWRRGPRSISPSPGLRTSCSSPSCAARRRGSPPPIPWTLTVVLRETSSPREGSHESARRAAGARSPRGRR